MTDTPVDPSRDDDDEIAQSVKAVMELNAKSFEIGLVYTTVVIALGYGALFTVWGFVKNDIGPKSQAAVGLLMVVSIASFIAFETYKVWSVSRGLIAVRDVLRNNQPGRQTLLALAQLAKRRADHGRQVLDVWPYSFWISVFTGFLAALILGSCFVTMLFG